MNHQLPSSLRPYRRKEIFGGFTIIETLMVLAVAGVIMAVVFLAVPQLQRNSRDQARKAIANRIRGEIENYGSNHEGTYPFSNVGNACPGAGAGTAGDWSDFYQNNLSKLNINDPSLGSPVISCQPTATFRDNGSYVAPWSDTEAPPMPESKGILDIVTDAVCSGSSVTASTTVNSYAIIIGLDNAGSHYCIDNS